MLVLQALDEESEHALFMQTLYEESEHALFMQTLYKESKHCLLPHTLTGNMYFATGLPFKSAHSNCSLL